MDAHSAGPRVVLEADRCAAGDAVGGRVVNAETATPVVLERVEERPHGRRAFGVARAAPAADGTFALAVPAQRAPDRGRDALRTVLPRAGGRRRGAPPRAAGGHAAARPHARRRARPDRPPHPQLGRAHFHIELERRRPPRRRPDRGTRPPPRAVASVPDDDRRRLPRVVAVPVRAARGAPRGARRGCGATSPASRSTPTRRGRGSTSRCRLTCRPRSRRGRSPGATRSSRAAGSRRGRAETAARTPLLHEESALVWARA